jgi:hypothetical protein
MLDFKKLETDRQAVEEEKAELFQFYHDNWDDVFTFAKMHAPQPDPAMAEKAREAAKNGDCKTTDEVLADLTAEMDRRGLEFDMPKIIASVMEQLRRAPGKNGVIDLGAMLQPTIPDRKHQDDMRALGFTIDNHCYPPLAYKGERFRPDETHQCYTELESTLIRQRHENPKTV